MIPQWAQDEGVQKNGPTWIVIGASGLLGCNFVLEARNRARVWATFQKHSIKIRQVTSVALDARDTKGCVELFRQVRPNWVLNAAALTDVDYCEQHPDEATQVNSMAAEGLALAARDVGAGFVQISTDSVFDGTRGGYRETDPTRPLNAYARSKVEAEERVLTASPHSLIIRTNFFGWGTGLKASYSEWLLTKLAAADPFPVFSDVSFNPLLTNTVATMVLDLTEQQHRGVVHLGSREPCTKLEFARKLAEIFGFDTTQAIRPTPIHAVSLRAPRPRQTSLNIRLAERLLSTSMPEIEGELVRLRDLAPELRRELRNSMNPVRENTCRSLP
jgi:dTDP-4-dehydrorhamnose reductase